MKVGRKNKDEDEDRGRSSAKSASSAQAFALLPFDPIVSGDSMKSVQERREDEKEFPSWSDQARPPENVPGRCPEKSERKRNIKIKKN